MAIFVYCGFSGYLTVKDTFPFMIKMGSTRTAFVVSVIVFNLILAFIMSGISTFLTKLISFFNETFDNNNLSMYATTQLTSINDTWYNTLLLDFLSVSSCLLYSYLWGHSFIVLA